MKITDRHRERFQKIQMIGCVPCLLEASMQKRPLKIEPCDVHHLLSGGKRIGHDATVGCCPWHHRAVPKEKNNGRQFTREEMTTIFGPSLALSSKCFHERYGDDQFLLNTQNRLLRNWCDYGD